jgi:hypothetical protein
VGLKNSIKEREEEEEGGKGCKRNVTLPDCGLTDCL